MLRFPEIGSFGATRFWSAMADGNNVSPSRRPAEGMELTLGCLVELILLWLSAREGEFNEEMREKSKQPIKKNEKDGLAEILSYDSVLLLRVGFRQNTYL